MEEVDFTQVDFKEVIGRFIEKMGFEVESTDILMDGSVDFRAKTTNPVGGSVKSLIRASPYTRLVDEKDIESLTKRMRDLDAVRAAYITTSGFSDEAVEAVKDKPVSLINKFQLMESLHRRGLTQDEEFMESLEKVGMGEKFFQGHEQSFISELSEAETRAYFKAKAGKNERVVKTIGRYAPVTVMKVVTTKDIWTQDQILRRVEKKDYLFVNLTNMDLYYIMQKRKKNKTENTFLRSNILKQIHDLPENSKQHLMHLLEHGDLPIEDLEGKELSILKNKKVITIYEGRKGGAESFTEYMMIFLEGLLEWINLVINEIVMGFTTLGEGSETGAASEKPAAKKVTAQINMPHLFGGIYDLWKYLRSEKSLRAGDQVDPIVFSSRQVGYYLKRIFNAEVKSEGLIFMPYFRAKYIDENKRTVSKYEILYTPKFKAEIEPRKKEEKEVKTPRIKAKKKPLAGDFKLIK